MFPPGRYWAIPEVLIAGSWPTHQDLEWLETLGVSLLVNLTEREYDDERFVVRQIPVCDFMAPEIEQIDEFCRLLAIAEEAGQLVYLHCWAGCGRTGTMAACALVKREGITAREAIDRVRELRECSIESDEQEDGVARWVEYLAESDAMLR